MVLNSEQQDLLYVRLEHLLNIRAVHQDILFEQVDLDVFIHELVDDLAEQVLHVIEGVSTRRPVDDFTGGTPFKLVDYKFGGLFNLTN